MHAPPSNELLGYFQMSLSGLVADVSMVSYTINHTTDFRYSAPISESIMELRMHPRTEGSQWCRDFRLEVNPNAHVMSCRDHLGNVVHHFDVPARHTQLTIRATTHVEVAPLAPLPDNLALEDWDEIDQEVENSNLMEWLMPGKLTEPTASLRELQRELDLGRQADPLTTLRNLNETMRRIFDYRKQSTSVTSSIDDALRMRCGVCQDFTHITLALLRGLGIPARYVSGYLYQTSMDDDRSSPGATHAWLEAHLPKLGWIGFDPTNNTIARERHIRTAVGRDYADVPPTRGVYKGRTETELSVAVHVSRGAAPSFGSLPTGEPALVTDWILLDSNDQGDQQQ